MECVYFAALTSKGTDVVVADLAHIVYRGRVPTSVSAEVDIPIVWLSGLIKS